MRPLLYSVFAVILSGCAAAHIEGTWRYEDDNLIASFIFRPGNECIFGFVPKTAPDGISPACTYVVDYNTVTVAFKSGIYKNSDTMLLQFDADTGLLTELKTNEAFFNFKFRRLPGITP